MQTKSPLAHKKKAPSHMSHCKKGGKWDSIRRAQRPRPPFTTPPLRSFRVSAQDDMLPMPRKRSKSVGATVEARYQNACSQGYLGEVEWPSDGGTLEDANRELERLEGRETAQIVILGLVRGGSLAAREDRDRCCSEGGHITGQIQLQGNPRYPAVLTADDWRKIAQIEKEGFIGFRMLDDPEKWVLTWEPGLFWNIHCTLPRIDKVRKQSGVDAQPWMPPRSSL